MTQEGEVYNVRVLLEGEMAQRFETIKRFYGLQKNADLLRLLVTMKYEELRAEKKVPEIDTIPAPALEHFNLNEHGVLILDRTLNPPKGRIIQVFFRPEGVACELCEGKCKHVEFALNIPKVQEIIRKKGWKIE